MSLAYFSYIVSGVALTPLWFMIDFIAVDKENSRES